jgi:tape measure domain-containing protein
MAENINIKIDIQGKSAIASLQNVEKSAKKLGDTAEKSAKKASNAFSTFAGVLGANLVTGAIRSLTNAVVGFGKTAIKEAANIEKINTSFTTLLGSTEAAEKTVRELQEFTASTPFRLNGVTASAQKLIAFGFEADSIVDKLRKIGDVAAGSGADLQEVSLIYGQVAAAGKLTGERLLQFQERAIPIGPAIAKTMGIAENAVKDTVSKGQVSLAIFEKAFASLSQEGNLFFEGTVRQSKTLTGVISTLEDNFALLASNVGQEALPQIKEFATTLITFIQENQSDIVGFFQNLVKYSDDFVQGLTGIKAAFSDAFPDKTTERIQQIDQRIFNLTDGIATLKKKLDESKEEKGFFGSLFGDSRSGAEIEAALRKNIELVKELQAERRKLTTEETTGEDETSKVEKRAAKVKEIEQEKFDFIRSLKEAEKERDNEDALLQDETEQLRQDESFARLEANLGREKALQIKHEAEMLQAQGKLKAKALKPKRKLKKV